MPIDVSTHQLAQSVSSHFGSKSSIDEVLKCWQAVGKAIIIQLEAHKAVKLSSLGLVSLTPTEQPVFIMSADLYKQFKLKQKPQPTPDTIQSSSLNLAQVSKLTGISREMVEKIYTKMILVLGRAILEGRSILLSILKIGEITIENGEFSFQFSKDLVDKFNGGQPSKGKPSNAPRPASASRQRPSSAAAAPPPPPRARNPIIHDNASVASSDLLFSPRSITSSSSGKGNTNNVQSRGALSRDNLNRLMSNNNTSNNKNSSNNNNGVRNPITNRPSSAPRLGGRQGQGSAREIAARAIDSGNVGDIIEKIRAKVIARGGANGMRTLSRLLMIMDDSGDKRLSREEFRTGLRDYGIDLNTTELEQVFMYFDRDRNGSIDVTEFLVGMRGEMSDRRRAVVKMAFDILDKDRSGYVDIEELLSVYDMQYHPDVREGKRTVQEAMREFMAQWDRTDHDGVVTLPEFEDYYKDISSSIDDDDYFELMIRNAWRIAGGKGLAANSANRRVLVTHSDGRQSVETVHNDLGLKGGDREGARARLAQQGVQGKVDLYGGVDNTTPARQSGGRAVGPATGPSRNTFERNTAAAKLAAAYRGRIARKEVAHERRKADTEERVRREEEHEANRPKPRQILRPKGKSYINF